MIGALFGQGVSKISSLRSYSTAFALTENPISEGSIWTSGSALTVMRTTSARCFGTQTGTNGDDDSIAALNSGIWHPNQSVSGTIHKAGSLTGSGFREIELVLHFQGGHWIECNLAYNGAYQDVVYIINPGGNTQGTDFIFLNATPGSGGPGSVSDGAVFSAQWLNGTVTTFINGTPFQSCPDTSPLKTGAPGIGSFISGTSLVPSEYCFSNFSAAEL